MSLASSLGSSLRGGEDDDDDSASGSSESDGSESGYPPRNLSGFTHRQEPQQHSEERYGHDSYSDDEEEAEAEAEAAAAAEEEEEEEEEAEEDMPSL